jgi:SagB-type dehydrogenase family enzyme
MAQDYALRTRRAIDEADFSLLARLNGWTRPCDLEAAFPGETPAAVRARLDTLVRARFVEASTDPIVPDRRAASAWASWAPEAALFHFATKDGRRLSLPEATKQLYDNLAIEEYPDTVKKPARGKTVGLPPFAQSGALPEVLLSRRTWRRFGDQPVTLDQLSTLLGLTWGVQQWMRIGPEIRSALKTSPSGGACHSLEAYIVASRVDGLAPGIYHYNPDTHDLERVRTGLPDAPIVTYLGGQPWYQDCGALFLMTAVMPRVRWKYRFPRAYRSVLLEAGHFCQTFCLVSTWLGLAPFCTAVFADSIIERALRIDGVEETVIYAAGVGTRPDSTAWAPMPEGHRPPTLEPPSYRARQP